MAGVRGGVSSSGSTNTRRAGHLPLPCNVGPTEASCGSPGSSLARSKASRAAACYAADAKPKLEVEASAGRSRKMLLEISVTGGRSRRYGSIPALSNGAASLTHHCSGSASPSPCVRGGDGYRETHGGEEVSSSVTPVLLPDITGQASSSDNYNQHAGAFNTTNEYRLTKPRVNQNLLLQKEGQEKKIRLQITSHTSLLDSKVERANQVPPRFIHKAKTEEWMHRAHSGDNHQQVGAIDATKTADCPRLNQNLLLQEEGQGSFPTRADFMEPSSTEPKIGLQATRHTSQLDSKVERANQVPPRFIHKAKPEELIHQAHSSGDNHQEVGEIDTTNKCRLPKDLTVQASSSSRFSRGHSVEDEATRAGTAYTSSDTEGIWDWENEVYIDTLGPGGGYGYPHPPPFYRCDVCHKIPAFYRLRCCLLVVCEHCSCTCEPPEAAEDDAIHGKDELPEVKLEGSDLFLWQQCSFPANLMLCKAKRAGNRLQYYFAEIGDLMEPEVEVIRTTVYSFCLQGFNTTSLTVTVEDVTRNQWW